MKRAPRLMSMPPSKLASPAPGQLLSEAKMVLWSIQMRSGIRPVPRPSMVIESAPSPPGSSPIVMFRTMTLRELPTMKIPKLAVEPCAPSMVMSLLSLISTTTGSLVHCPQGSVMLRKSKVPV